MKKAIASFILFITIITMASKSFALSEPIIDKGEYQELKTNLENSKDYFITKGVSTYIASQDSFRLLNGQKSSNGYIYMKDRINPNYDFKIEMEIDLYNIVDKESPADGVVFGLSENSIGKSYDGDGLGQTLYSSENAILYVIDTYKNTNDAVGRPNISVRYTKDKIQNNSNVYDHNGKSIGIDVPSYATNISTKYFDTTTKLTIQYNKIADLVTFKLENGTTTYERTGKLESRGKEKGLSFFVSAASGLYSDRVYIKPLSMSIYLKTHDLSTLGMVENSNGSYTFTPKKKNNDKYPQNSQLYIPGLENPLIIGTDGSVIVPKNSMPQYDAYGSAYIKEPDRGRSNDLINQNIPGYQTITPLFKKSIGTDGIYRIQLEKPDGSNYSTNSKVKFNDSDEEFTVQSNGSIIIPLNKLPRYDSIKKMKVKEGNKEYSSEVEILMDGTQTVAPEKITQEQDYYGNLKITLQKPDGTNYRKDTEVEYKGKKYLVLDNGTIMIPAEELEAEATTIPIRVKETNKLVSEDKEFNFLGLNSSQRKVYEKEVRKKADEIKTKINDLTGLTNSQVTNLLTELEAVLESEVTNILSTRTPTLGKVTFDNAIIKIEEKYNEALIYKYKNEKESELKTLRDELTARIQTLESLTASEKEAFIDKLNDQYDITIAEILIEKNNEDIDVKKNKGVTELKKIFLESYKKNSIKEYEKKEESAKNTINGLNIDDEDKRELLFEIDKITSNITNGINNALTEEQVYVLLETAEKNLSRLIQQATTTELEELRKIATDNLNAKRIEEKERISKMIELNDEEKDAYYREIDNIADSGISGVKTANTQKDINEIYRDKLTLMVDEIKKAELESHKKAKIKELDGIYERLSERVESRPYLTTEDKDKYKKELTDERKKAKDSINQTEKVSEMDDAITTATKEMQETYMKAYKENAKNEMNRLLEDATNEINSLKFLSREEKEIHISKLISEKEARESLIDKAANTNEVDTYSIEFHEFKDKELLIAKKLNERRVDGLSQIDERYKLAKKRIQEEPLFNDYYVSEFMGLLNQFKQKADDAILNANISELDQVIAEELEEITAVYLAVSKQLAYEEIDQEVNNLYAFISGLSSISDQEKTTIIKQIQEKTHNELGILVMDLKTEEAVEIKKQELINYYKDMYAEVLVLNRNREESKKEIDEFVNRLVGEEKATSEVNQLIDSAKKDIDKLNVKEDMDKVASQTIELIKEHIYEKLNEEKNKLREKLESISINPISDEVKQIIQDSIDELNEGNYGNESEKDRIEQSAVNKIKNQEAAQVREKVKKELEEAATKPISENVSNVIEIESHRINNTNYDNEDKVKEIIKNGKEAIIQQEVEDVKEKIRNEIESKLDKPLSTEVEAIISEQLNKITEDNYKDDNKLREIKDEIENLIKKQQIEEMKKKYQVDLKKEYDKLINHNKYESKELEELKNIYDNAIENMNKDPEKSSNIHDQAVKDLNQVKQSKEALYNWIFWILLAIIIIEIITIYFKKKRISNK